MRSLLPPNLGVFVVDWLKVCIVLGKETNSDNGCKQSKGQFFPSCLVGLGKKSNNCVSDKTRMEYKICNLLILQVVSVFSCLVEKLYLLPPNQCTILRGDFFFYYYYFKTIMPLLIISMMFFLNKFNSFLYRKKWF